MKKSIILTIILLLLCVNILVTADSSSQVIETDLDEIRQVIREQLAGYDYQDLLLIKGSNLSIQEELIMAFAQQQLPELSNIRKRMDTDINNLSFTTSNYEQLIFLGGEETNRIVHDLQQTNQLQITNIYSYTSFRVSIASYTTTNLDILIFSTTLENTLLQNNAPQRSPLSQVMDKRIVPLIATITSISILHLINLFGNTISEFFFDFTSEKLGDRKKRKHKTKKKSNQKQSIRILKEIITIILASIIFALALSWTWTPHLSGFLSLFTINLAVIGLFYIIRESLRFYYSKKYMLHTEHVFWPTGSLITIGSTILGNTFSLASYTYLENEENEKRYSKMYYTIFRLLFMITIFAFVINIFMPSTMLQMFYVFTIMNLFIDMTPIKPMDGYEVKQWNKRKWILLYIFVFISYFIIMFSTLIT